MYVLRAKIRRTCWWEEKHCRRWTYFDVRVFRRLFESVRYDFSFGENESALVPRIKQMYESEAEVSKV